MKLCRFELAIDPGVSRSGIYHDSRFYETDGESAVGIHDPGSVRMLAPMGTPPSVRLFDEVRDASGQPFLTYSFGNPSRMQGPNTEVLAALSEEELEFEVRIAAVTQDSGVTIDPLEAPRLVLGFGILVTFFEPDTRERLAELGLGTAPAQDLAWLFGPFLVTPDELVEHRSSPDPLEFGWAVSIQINGETVHEGVQALPSFGTLLAIASSKGPVLVGELLASPAFTKPPLVSTSFGRNLIATDRVHVTVEPLGTLVARIA